jgi:penicillin-insensitive murein endopeptidase
MIAYLEKLADESKRLDGWNGLLVGDISQPFGGPMLGGHASHQLGIDADIWFKPMPDHQLTAQERENIPADIVVDPQTLTVDPKIWSDAYMKLLKRAASYPEVARIFVNPAIKKYICDNAGPDRKWIGKVRPWWKHDDHFHVRLNCPPDSPGCKPQPPVPQDDGCGKELDDWFKRLRAPPPPKSEKPPVPAKPLLLTSMPKECQDLVAKVEAAQKTNIASAPK